jgi:catechol-2,3-dioxygenase
MEVSEVGLPVADVGAAADFLEAELGLAHFSGDRESFSAVGDDRGLFILVPVGRPWLFTDRPAADAPVRVTIEGSAERELRVPGSSHVIKLASL